MLRLIKRWLKVPVETTSADGKRQMEGGTSGARALPAKFVRVNDPDLIKTSGLGYLVAHTQTPRFVGKVSLGFESLRVVTKTDDLNAWSSARAAPGDNPQKPLFELCSQMIAWARANFAGEDADKSVWKPLPDNAFSGRAATRADLDAGKAFFVLEGGRPIDIPLPQYALMVDVETDEPTPCILLQAEEESRGDKPVAYLNLRTREPRLALFEAFKLLGQKPPNVQPIAIATSAYESISRAVKNFSGMVSVEQTVEQKRLVISENQDQLDDIVSECMNRCHAAEAFAVLDGMKSLVSRDLMLKNRARKMGIPKPDIMVHAIDVQQIAKFLESDPESCVFSVFQSPRDEFIGFMLWVDGSDVRSEKFSIATGQAGHELAAGLNELARHRTWAQKSETEGLINPVIDLFGSEIIPRIQRLSGQRKLIIIPHRSTHMVPFHMMRLASGETAVELDDVVQRSTYASSLTAFDLARGMGGKPTDGNGKLAALCVDVENLGAGARFEVDAYRNMFRDAEGVVIATQVAEIPRDLSKYPMIVWSGHGMSDPYDWQHNRLAFQTETFTADRIAGEWDLGAAGIAILAACDTGIDRSMHDKFDEYFGLDMAFQIAGCRTTASTHWGVGDELASYVAVQLVEGVIVGSACSEHLNVIRRLLRSGGWFRMTQIARDLVGKDLSVSNERRKARLSLLEFLLSRDKYAFAHMSQWGAFRSFGGW